MAGVEQVIGGLDSWGSGGALQGGVMTGCICNLKAYVLPGLKPFTCRWNGWHKFCPVSEPQAGVHGERWVYHP